MARDVRWLHHSNRRTVSLDRVIWAGLLQAFGVGLLMHQLHAGTHETQELTPTLHWLRDSLLALPLSILVVAAVTPVARRAIGWSRLQAGGGTEGPAARWAWAMLSAAAYAVVSIPAGQVHERLFETGHTQALSFLAHATRDGAAVLGGAFVLLAVLALGWGAPWEAVPARRVVLPWPTLRRLGKVLTACAVLLPGLPILPGTTPALAATTSCAAAGDADQSYDVAAVSVVIPFNRWGDVLPNGQVYTLQGDKAAVKNWSLPLNANPALDPAGNRRLRPRPLVLRANPGQCVKVTFTNELDANLGGAGGLPVNPRAAIHVHGAAVNVQTSDGSMVGFNADTTVPNSDDPATAAVENRTAYYWRAPSAEGLFMFHDHATPAGAEHDAGSTGNGLFGALVVEPPGSTWTDSVSGAPLYSGTGTQSGELYINADIKPGSGRAFRETVQLGWDEIPGVGLGFNYGSEPQSRRDAHPCADCVGEGTSLSSWAFGDPALVKLASGPGPWLADPVTHTNAEDCGLAVSCYTSNVFHAYNGDPTKIRFGHAGSKETHVFHLHAHQWLAEPKDVGASGPTPGQPSDTARPESTTIDSQTMGPGEMFTADLLFGAGSKPGTFGDSIFHCHLYPHFAEGFWSLFRVHDVLEAGTGKTPDGVLVNTLQALVDRSTTATGLLPEPTPDNPGYPRFMPGRVGWRAPQPPGGITVGGPTGPAATRIVAGQAVTAAAAAVESAVQKRYYGSSTPKPGAPFRDPCPTGAREVTYNVTVLQRNLVYNEAGEHDPQGRLLVLDKDRSAILAGTKQPEPLFIRVNSGDCINFNLTNWLPNFFGNDAFQKLIQTNLVGEHIHLVKFDVTASDGATNGWNYQEAAFSKDQADFNAALLNGTRTCNPDPAVVDGCRIPTPATWDPNTGTNPATTAGQTIHERWFADYELRTIFTHDHHFPAVDQASGLYGALVVEPKAFDVRNPLTGEYYAPVNDPAHGTVCGNACEAVAAGAKVDMVGPGTKDDFREFGLAMADFVPQFLPGPALPSSDPNARSNALNPPPAPELFGQTDPGVMSINYKNAPFRLRQSYNGKPVDPAYVMSSSVFGDPQTPLLQAYSGDGARVRLIQGSQEEQHVFTIHGQRWRNEPDDPESPLVNSRAVGISEAFNFEVPQLACGTDETRCRGDFLYSGTATDDLYTGMWGILRVFQKQTPSLLPLPDNVPAAKFNAKTPQPSQTGTPPTRESEPGAPCPSTAPLKHFDVVAFEKALTYNGAGDNDPYGLVYALAADEGAIKNGSKKAQPLALRAAEGDCIEVSLANHLTTAFLNHHGAADGDPNLPVENGVGNHTEEGAKGKYTPAGLRVSLHPQLLRYEVRGSDGATVGFNKDQTVGPGETPQVYRWYADDPAGVPGELGATNLTDYGDLRGHRHHGLFAGLTIEPKGATFHDPATGAPVASGVSADVRVPGVPDFRDFTVFFQDGLNLRDKSGVSIPDAVAHPPAPGEPAPPPGQRNDAEDQGQKGLNYANAALSRRLGYDPAASMPTVSADGWAHVFSSTGHNDTSSTPYGDPLTPIFRAYSGDPARVRVLQGADKPRQHAFNLSGHSWLAEPDDPQSELIGTAGGISVGRAVNVVLPAVGLPGDYRYGCQVSFHHLSAGLWGILRVYPRPPVTGSSMTPTALAAQDTPYASPAPHPLKPLGPGVVTATVYEVDSLGLNKKPTTQQAQVQSFLKTGTSVETVAEASGRTGSDGTGVTLLSVLPGGAHSVTLTPPPGWKILTGNPVVVDLTSTAENGTASVSYTIQKILL